jgi:hypothetical protein
VGKVANAVLPLYMASDSEERILLKMEKPRIAYPPPKKKNRKATELQAI